MDGETLRHEHGRTLDNLTDVTAPTPTDNDALTWDAATGKWIPEAVAGGAGTPAVSVTDETTFGITPAVGTGTNYARQDHTHGSPTDPVTAHATDTSTHGASDIADVSDIAVDANLSVAAQAAISVAHAPNADTDLNATFEATFSKVADIDDAPVDGVTTAPISSNWAFDHVAASDPHTGYRLESADHTHASTGAQGGALYVPRTFGWYIGGGVATGTEQGITYRTTAAMTAIDVELHVKTAPTGASLIVDINEAGTTLFSTRPEIDAAGTTEDNNHAFSDTALASGAEITIDIDQVGSTIAGADLSILLHCKELIRT